MMNEDDIFARAFERPMKGIVQDTFALHRVVLLILRQWIRAAGPPARVDPWFDGRHENPAGYAADQDS